MGSPILPLLGERQKRVYQTGNRAEGIRPETGRTTQADLQPSTWSMEIGRLADRLAKGNSIPADRHDSNRLPQSIHVIVPIGANNITPLGVRFNSFIQVSVLFKGNSYEVFSNRDTGFIPVWMFGCK